MVREKRGSIAGGIILLVLGVVFLIQQVAPQLFTQWFGAFSWPWIIIGIGLLFLVAGLLSFTGGFLIPGAIITTIGGLLYYQNATNDWESWAYAWPLIPAAVGLGLLLASVVDRSPGSDRQGARKVGVYMLGISLAVFALFWSFFTAQINFDLIWPVILILIGLAFLARSFYRK